MSSWSFSNCTTQMPFFPRNGERLLGEIFARHCQNGLIKIRKGRFCLVNMDVDIYEPTMIILEGCWDRVVSGGVLILDEYATSKWPGETRAWDDFAKKRGLEVMLNRFSWANAPGAYVIKP